MPTNPLAINFPQQSIPMVDPASGQPSAAWWYVQQALLNRTGGPSGVSTSDTLSVAETALADAEEAQQTATAADAAALQAQHLVAVETARALAAEALLAPKASPVFSGVATAPEYALSTTPTWTGGAGVPTSTQPRGSCYSRTGGAVGSTFYISQGGGTWNPIAGV